MAGMLIRRLHPWKVSPARARQIQQDLRRRLRLEDDVGVITRIAGADVGPVHGSGRLRAAVAVFSFPQLEVLETRIATAKANFPYVPGLLSFRELPVLARAFRKLQCPPDLVLCDGQGQAHPRRMGLASHLGLLLDIPTIGVAKSKLTGSHGPLPWEKGSWVPLLDNHEVIGAVLRSRNGVQPLYISPGHRISLEKSIDCVMACLGRYRLPETTRLADWLASDRGRSKQHPKKPGLQRPSPPATL